MNCNPAPEINCGTVTPDTCVAITMSDPTNGQTPINWACFLGSNFKKECYRQSEFNFFIGNKVCSLSDAVKAIEDQLGFTGNLNLSGCTTFTPANTTVAAELQALYTQLCKFQYDLNQPISGLNLKCLEDPCGNPIGTLGQLLQALINCCCSSESPTGSTTGFTVEAWKTLDASGNMENGQPIPAFTGTVPNAYTARLRKADPVHAELNLWLVLTVNGLGIGPIFTLPVGYRPQVTLNYPITCISNTSTDTVNGFIKIEPNGNISLNVDVSGTSDRDFIVGLNTSVATD